MLHHVFVIYNKIVKKKNILAFGAHLDDIELGCYATLIKLKKYNVYLIVISN